MTVSIQADRRTGGGGPAGALRHRLRRRPLGRYRYVRLRWRVLFALVDAVGRSIVAAARAARRTWWAARRSLRFVVPHSPDRPAPSGSCRVGDRQALWPPSDPAGSALERILLIQLDHLGDAIISTVMLPLLRRRFPRASIEVLAAPWNCEVFQSSPEVDRVYVSRVNRFARGRRLGWILATIVWGLRLRRRRIDLGIDIRGEFPHAVLLWLSGARHRVGWPSGGGGFLLTRGVVHVADRPEAESRLALLAAAGIPPAPDVKPRPIFRPTAGAGREIRAGLADLDKESPLRGPRIVVHVGAGTPAKRWPVQGWRGLIGHLRRRADAQVILVGDHDDGTTAQSIRGQTLKQATVDWTGRLSLDQLAALLEQSDLLVGPDSGPAHLAAAVGTPVVVLFSGTNNPRQWRPVGGPVAVLRNPVACSPCHRRRCPLPDHPCMTGIPVARVAETIERMLRFPSAHSELR